jgi:glycerol-3-phosphate acyltransferase PlsY
MPDPINWQLAAPLFVMALLFGYLIGSVPFGLILTRMAGMGDIRAIGSGNIGATNVLRTGNKKLAAGTLVLDALKGTAAVLIAGYYGPDAAGLAGLGAFLGHLFPVWLKFKGGKGVATFLGVCLGLFWPAALVFAIVWLLTAFISRLFVSGGPAGNAGRAGGHVFHLLRPPADGVDRRHGRPVVVCPSAKHWPSAARPGKPDRPEGQPVPMRLIRRTSVTSSQPDAHTS